MRLTDKAAAAAAAADDDDDDDDDDDAVEAEWLEWSRCVGAMVPPVV